jgi:uncharacterized protein
MAGLPLFISFSTRCAELGSGALLSSDGTIVFLAPEKFIALTGTINIPGELAMSEAKYAAYEALGPFFEIIMKGLSGVVDGDHYFDTIAEDAKFEFLYEFPGWPRTIRGRAALMTAYSGYGNSIRLRSADKLVVYHADKGKVVIIEYEVHGKVLRTGAPYDNRFVSIITVADRKIVHWRDYMDSLAAWKALNPGSS